MASLPEKIVITLPAVMWLVSAVVAVDSLNTAAYGLWAVPAWIILILGVVGAVSLFFSG